MGDEGHLVTQDIYVRPLEADIAPLIRHQAQMAAKALNVRLEFYVKACLKPKPKWMPHRLWRWLIPQLFYVEQHPLRIIPRITDDPLL